MGHVRRDGNFRANSSLRRLIDLVHFRIRNGVGENLFQFFCPYESSFYAFLAVYAVGTHHDDRTHQFLVSRIRSSLAVLCGGFGAGFALGSGRLVCSAAGETQDAADGKCQERKTLHIKNPFGKYGLETGKLVKKRESYCNPEVNLKS